jgi:hypothetical protein
MIGATQQLFLVPGNIVCEAVPSLEYMLIPSVAKFEPG